MTVTWDNSMASIAELLQREKDRITRQLWATEYLYPTNNYINPNLIKIHLLNEGTTAMADVKTETVAGKKVTVGRFQGTKLNNNTQVTITGTYDVDYKAHNILIANKQELKDLYKLLGELVLEEVK